MSNKHLPKRYRCTKCGHIVEQTTNHYGNTWSWGHVNCCPNCPPYAKYPEFGGQTVWECLDKEEEEEVRESDRMWRAHLEKLTEEGSEFAEPLGWLCESDNFIGFETGNLRPGDLGKYDFYYFCLQAGFGPPEEAAEAAMLDYSVIRAEENKEDARRADVFKNVVCGEGSN